MQAAANDKYWITAWAAVQGIMLLLLHSLCTWLSEPMRYFWFLWPLYAIAVWLPLSAQMLSEHRCSTHFWRILGSFIIALSAMAAYKGWSIWSPGLEQYHYWNSDAAPFCLATAVLWFVLLPFAQLRLEHGAWGSDYPFLFNAAWRNALQLASAGLFTGVLWLLLWLWAGLFAMLGVKLFADVFSSRFFTYPVTGIAFGTGLYLYRSRETAIYSLYFALLQIMGWLLPLAALVAVIFLAALPFTGLQPLWKTRHAGALLLTLQGFMLLLFNATWQDGSNEPQLPRWLLRPLAWAMALLPIFAGLNVYSLYLRVDQYGWSGERVWAALLIFICASLGFGYAYTALRRNDRWMAGVARVNVTAALLLAALLAATATPLLDPERIGVASQVGRLLSGKIKADAFDYRYLHFETGRFGNEALQQLAGLMNHPQADEIRKQAVAMQKQKDRLSGAEAWTEEELAAQFQIYPPGTTADPSFFRFLSAKVKAEPWTVYCLRNGNSSCLLLVLDLNGDGDAEHILLQNANSGEAYRRNGKEWQRLGEFTVYPYSAGDPETLKRDLQAGKLRLPEPEWRDVEIGDRKFIVRRQ